MRGRRSCFIRGKEVLSGVLGRGGLIVGSCHIFYEKRAIDVPDGLPKWAGHKGESELMPETMPEEQGAGSIKI